tara:strand:- start:75 stop:647 length:573 start_codon:yes stop_codon:yes gene_type:complete
MATVTTGYSWSNEQITPALLNQMWTSSTFNASVVDDSTTVLSGGAIIVKDGGVTLQKLASALKDAIYPVGSIYTNATNSANPATFIGFGTWAAFGAGRVPVGIDGADTDFDTAEETGGSKTHTLTTSEIPSHTHTYSEPTSGSAAKGIGGGAANPTAVGRQTVNSGSTGGGGAHNNLQPYIAVYMWKRTA